MLRLDIRMREDCVPERSWQGLGVRLGQFAKQLVLISLVPGSGWVGDNHADNECNKDIHTNRGQDHSHKLRATRSFIENEGGSLIHVNKRGDKSIHPTWRRHCLSPRSRGGDKIHTRRGQRGLSVIEGTGIFTQLKEARSFTQVKEAQWHSLKSRREKHSLKRSRSLTQVFTCTQRRR